MSSNIEALAKHIAQIAPMLHTAGPISPKALLAIYEHSKTQKIRCSAETGSGASTLLLSHLSEHHFVFAKDDGSGSIANVRTSPLLNAAAVHFIEGPTQKTLPGFAFPQPLQLALIDGPHAYPFPDLEYYYIYQALSAGALLVLEDIHIRTIHNLFSFLKTDSMFRLKEVVGTTAFFIRTEAPTFYPTGDGWPSQRYNRRTLRRYDLARQTREMLPVKTRRLLKSVVRRFQNKSKICIDSPRQGALVGDTNLVSGRVGGQFDGFFVWILVRREDQASWWPQRPVEFSDQRGVWQCSVDFGDPQKPTGWFEIAAILVDAAINECLLRWRAGAEASLSAPILNFPFRSACVAEAYRRVQRS